MKLRLLFIGNEPAYFLSHRLPLAKAALARGYEVHVATRDAPGVAEIIALGFVHHCIPLTRSGMNPLTELNTLFRLIMLFRRSRPDIVHLVTVKPVVYGGIAARIARVPAVVSVISGLGYVFLGVGVRQRLLRAVVRRLYRVALGHGNLRVIFQNDADRDAFVAQGLVRGDVVAMVRGSGVDLDQFAPRPEPEGVPVVVMASRLLLDKGIVEYVEAAKLLKARGTAVRLLVAGDKDPNPACASDEEIAAWRRDGAVELLGFRSDMASVLADANVVVLPSYREGLPKVLMEAAACGRAVVTTDVPGCRDAIIPDVTGLLVPVRQATPLADAIERLVCDPQLRRCMGAAGRELAEREFGLEKIVGAQLAIYQELADAHASTAQVGARS